MSSIGPSASDWDLLLAPTASLTLNPSAASSSSPASTLSTPASSSGEFNAFSHVGSIVAGGVAARVLLCSTQKREEVTPFV